MSLTLATMAYSMQFADEGNTIRLRWKNSTIPITLSDSLTKQNPNIKSGSDVEGAVRRSFETWEKVANVRFEITTADKQSVSASGKSGDGASLLTISQTPENLLLFSGDTEEVSARTRTFFDRNGFITEADIVLNPYEQFSTDGSIGTFDLEATFTHEIGHLLGLEHSSIAGATMFERQGKNGIYGLPNFNARTLAEDDISGIRALYGAINSDVSCCGTLNGKLSTASGKTAKDTQVWIEETETGRVIAGVLTNSSGNFRIEGLSNGKFSVYAQDFGERKNSTAAQILGEVEISRGKTTNFTKKLKSLAKTFDIQYIGFNGQISQLAVPLNGGKSFMIYVGGKNLDADNLTPGFNSPYFTVSTDTITKQDYGSEISVISFEVKVSSLTPGGEYSFYLQTKNKEIAYLAGSLTVESFENPWSSSVFSGVE
jgi:hypothetical protein